MRRNDREITGISNIMEVLDHCNVMRIGLCVNNIPYIVPMNFGYEVTENEQVYLYFHGSLQGRKIDMILANNQACFEADCSYKTIEADQACGWTAQYQSVMGEGKIEILKEDSDKITAMDTIMKRYGFKGTPQYNPATFNKTALLRITVHSITGKQHI